MNITDSFLNFTLLGAEWVLWLLIALSVASVAICVERFLYFRRRRVDLERLKLDVRFAIMTGELGDAVDKYKESAAMPAMVAVSGLSQGAASIEAVAEAMNGAKADARNDHEKFLSFLGTLGNNAPFIGLFGTVLGIIRAFNDLSNNPGGNAEVVMAGISEALVATAVGLMVAIPAVIAFNYFNRRVRESVSGTDSLAHTILGALAQREGHYLSMEVD